MENKIDIKKIYVFFLSIYFIALPLGVLSMGSLGSFLRIIALVPVFFSVLYLFKMKFSWLHCVYILYFFVIFLSLVYSINEVDSKNSIFRYFMLMILILSTGAFSFDNKDIKTLKKSLVFASRLSVVLILIAGSWISGRLCLTNEYLNEDPNYFCMYLSFGFINSLDCFISKKRFINKFLYLTEMIVYVVIVILTGSRGGLLALLIGALCFYMFAGNKTFFIKKIILMFLTIAIIYVSLSFVSNELAYRFTFDSVVESGGTNRFDIWKQALDIFKNSSVSKKLFGYGISTIEYNFFINGYPLVFVAHNVFIEMLIDIGIIGCFVYSLMIFSYIFVSFKAKDKFSFCVIMCMFIMSLSTSILTFKPYINIMIFIVCVSKNMINKNEGIMYENS